MPLFLFAIWGFIKSSWKVLLPCVMIIGAGTCGYIKGKAKCELKHKQQAQEELIRRQDDERQERDRIEQMKEKIRQKAKDGDIDALWSCILSNDPFEVDCAK